MEFKRQDVYNYYEIQQQIYKKLMNDSRGKHLDKYIKKTGYKVVIINEKTLISVKCGPSKGKWVYKKANQIITY